MGEMKIGANEIGKIFLGDKQILGGGIANLLNEINIAADYVLNNNAGNFILIANLSTNAGIELVRGNLLTNIPKQHIEWYSLDLNSSYPLDVSNQSDEKLLRCIKSERFIRKDSNIPITNFKISIADYGDTILSIQKNSDDSDFKSYFAVIILFDEI